DEDLAWPETCGRVFRLPKTAVEVDQRSVVTPYGGLALFTGLARRFDVAKRIDDVVRGFRPHVPYHDADHVLAIAANLFVGGTCLEDQANLQHSEAVRRILGAVRIPDTTTGGDFLRRFEESSNPGALDRLRGALDELGEDVGRAVERRHGKMPLANAGLGRPCNGSY